MPSPSCILKQVVQASGFSFEFLLQNFNTLSQCFFSLENKVIRKGLFRGQSLEKTGGVKDWGGVSVRLSRENI